MVIRVGLIDDHSFVHDAVEARLREADDIALVGTAFDGEGALTLCRRHNPDVLLMDAEMPGLGGVAATRAVLAAFPDVRVLGLSSHEEYDFIRQMMDAGAHGYVIKHMIAEDLLDTIRATAQGNSVLSVEAARTLLYPPTDGEQTPTDFGLTERELEVLRLLARGRSNKEAAAQLEVSERTIRFHTNNILAKMNVATRSEALVLAAKHNLV
jgi:DNA-binding NarL/FixJ family response regulator